MKKILFILFLIISQFCFSQNNPLFSAKPESTVQADTSTNDIQEQASLKKKHNTINRMMTKNAELQYKFKESIASSANDYKNGKKISSIFIIFLFAFLYGVFHSLGPGHGKVLIFSYILTEKPKVLKAISTSYLIATVHALSGLIVASIIIISLKTYSTSANNIESSSLLISRFSYALIIAIGLFLLIKEIRNKGEHSHKFKNIPFILSVGLIPCPGTIILVTFLSAMGLTAMGYLSVLFIILGMGLTISLVGLISLFSKKSVSHIISRENKKTDRTYKVISIFGATLLILFGIFFFIGSFA